MNGFSIAAGMMAVIHLVAGWQRPGLAVIVSGILWLLYAVYEHLVATGVLCDANCSIRVDLLFLFPILGSQPTAPTSRTWGDQARRRSSARFLAQTIRFAPAMSLSLSAWLFSRCWRKALVTALCRAS